MKIHLTVILLLCLLVWRSAASQDSSPIKIPTDRLLFHDNVNRQQSRLLNKDGVVDISADAFTNLNVTESLLNGVNTLQEKIETDTALSNNAKKKYLRSLEAMLRGFNDNWSRPDFSPSLAPALVQAFSECMALDRNNESILPVIAKNEYGTGKILVECFLLPSENPGIAASRIELIRKYCALHPDDVLHTLTFNPNIYFADSLISVVARRDIRKFYDYAAVHNLLGSRIRRHPDTLVKVIARMANSRSGQIYFPFIDNLLRGTMTFEDIDNVKANDVALYRLMVKTRIEYCARMLPPYRDTAMGMKMLTYNISRKAKEYFISAINALHSVNDENVRFRRLDGLTPQELYYLAVLGEDEIYTSSFVKGVYPRIFQRMLTPRGDSLIISVKGDYFRKFIKMCAGYNTLNHFLASMDKDNANLLMKAFIIGLERTQGMEEAVDVADSYSSIIDKNPGLAAFVLGEARRNYDKNLENENRRGAVIYRLLKILFESADTAGKTDLSKELGIPPVYSVDYNSLKDDSGRVVMQAFFYGDEDKDGQHSFTSFMSMFRNRADWKVTENKEWVSIAARKGHPLMIFANRPLFGENDPEEHAINNLSDYLFDRKIKPTIYIHRGHSFHVKSTLRRIMPSARIVVLGSCGGYNNINDVLTISGDAHIISSKQTGTMHINEPIIQSLNACLTSGKNIDWIAMWKELGARFNSGDAREKFDDYIPPYKNLGAIFIKAYNRSMAAE